MKRVHQIILIAALLPLSWLWMMAVHESGHVAAAWLTGGTVSKVVLHPLAISRTDVSPNPRPLVVAWSGPLVGVVLPVLIWVVIAGARLPAEYLARFWAGFCCVSNGAYLGIGSLEGIGDCQPILQHGTPMWVLWLFGLSVGTFGLALWHRLGRHFGFGEPPGEVDKWAAYLSCVLLAISLALGFWLSPRG